MPHGQLFVRLEKCVRKRLTERQGWEERATPGGGLAAPIPGHRLRRVPALGLRLGLTQEGLELTQVVGTEN